MQFLMAFYQFTEQWLGSFSQVLLVFLGILVSLIIIVGLWDRRFRPLSIRGTRIGAPAIICLACLSVLTVGFATPKAMIGDEVTHYYMLASQAQDLSSPNFFANIPQATGKIETRRYPHSFLWHYFGALVYRLTGNSFFGVQLYQAFFLFQLLTVAYLLARSRGGVNTRSALIYLLTLASLPLCLIFSVAFYQDVPVTAQVLTAFYLLRKNKWFIASCFVALAIGLKETTILIFPAFFILLIWWRFKESGFVKGVLSFICSILLIFGFTFVLGKTVNIYGHASFYPLEKLERMYSVVKGKIEALVPGKSPGPEIAQNTLVSTAKYKGGATSETKPQVIANNPGDLRIKENFFVYGGILLWLVVILGTFLNVPFLKNFLMKHNLISNERGGGTAGWLYFTGGSFLLMAAYFGRTAPDARFFLPGLPFVLLPFAESIARLKRTKLLIILFATLAILQGGYVLAKTYRLRVVSPAITAGIAYLAEHPPVPPEIFMYPEGNYRLFPIHHEWYLGYRLREFWRANNDKRIEMLRHFGVGAIVIKKYLIAPVDKEITNLGVYPPQFVKDLSRDPRFTKVFENKDLLIFALPTIAKPETK